MTEKLLNELISRHSGIYVDMFKKIRLPIPFSKPNMRYYGEIRIM